MSDTFTSDYEMHILSDGTATLYHGDNRCVLKTLPDNSIDSVCTDPPYALVSIVKRFGGANAAPAKGNDAYMRASAGFMNCNWDTGEVAFSEEFWAEVLRVLKPGGHVAAFGASRGYHRMACAIEDAGFEIRDSLMWVYGTGFPKSHDVSKGIDKAAGAERNVVGVREYAGGHIQRSSDDKLTPPIGTFVRTQDDRLVTAPATDAARQWEGWGTALKPAFEPIVLARKPLSEGTVAANVLRWGTGALNIDGCRVSTEDVAEIGKPSWGGPMKRLSAAPGQEGKLVPRTQPHNSGRWPANVVHDGSDEVIGVFPNAGGQQGRAKIGGAKGGSIYGKFAENVSNSPEPRNDSGSAARFFYSAKASKADRAGSKHPTVKPVALMEWLATLITPPGGTVLDPFAGSGTTGAASRNKGFKCILVEREDEYVEDIKRRLSTPAGPHVAAAVAAQQPANDNQPRDLFGEAA